MVGHFNPKRGPQPAHEPLTLHKGLPSREQALDYAKDDPEFLDFLATLYRRAGRHPGRSKSTAARSNCNRIILSGD